MLRSFVLLHITYYFLLSPIFPTPICSIALPRTFRLLVDLPIYSHLPSLPRCCWLVVVFVRGGGLFLFFPASALRPSVSFWSPPRGNVFGFIFGVSYPLVITHRSRPLCRFRVFAPFDVPAIFFRFDIYCRSFLGPSSCLRHLCPSDATVAPLPSTRPSLVPFLDTSTTFASSSVVLPSSTLRR